MTRKNIYRTALVIGAMVAAWSFATTDAEAQVRQSRVGDLFYNYYVPAPWGYGHGAQLYVSPRSTPPLVGHHWITYQPFMPHEYLYQHHRTYVSRKPDGSVVTTRVDWR